MKKQLFIIQIILLFIMLGVVSSHAQTTDDSLREALQRAAGAERVELLLELTEKIWRSDPVGGIEHAEEALEITRRLGRNDLEAKALAQRAAIYSAQNKHRQALEGYLATLELYRTIGNKTGEASTLHNLGLLYQSQSNYGKALDYYFQSLRIKEDLGDGVSASHTLTFIGIVYEKRNELENAIGYYQQAVSLSEEANDLKQIAITAGQTGNALKEAGRPEEAIAMFRKALSAADRLGSNHAKATILLDMSNLYQSQKAYDEAIRVNRQEVDNARRSGNLFLEAQGLENLGGIYRDTGEIAEAIKKLKAARSIFDTLNIGEGSIRNRTKLAHIYLDNAKYNDAVAEGLEALNRAVESKALNAQRDILQILAETYIEMGNFQDAFQVQNQLLAVKDSTFSRERERQISEMQARYETEQKEKEIALLENENEREVMIRNVFAAGFLLIIIIGFLVYNRQQLKIKKNQTDLENTRLKEQQLKQDLEFKNKQLTTHSLNLVQKNELMKDLKEEISEIKENPNGGIEKKLSNLQHMVDYSFNLDEDWEEFKLYFEEIHTGFFDALKTRYPNLTPNELRLSALVKLNLTIKEIATIMGISPDSVKTARYRLRKKLDMETEENLTEFMMGVEKEVTET